MGIPSNHIVVVLILVMMAIDVASAVGQHPPPPFPSPSGFKQGWTDTVDFMKHCAVYMHKLSPKFRKASAQCCTSAKKVDFSLFCMILWVPDIAMVFRPDKVANIASHCGIPLRPYTRCGSYIVRPPPHQSTTQNNDLDRANNYMTSLQ
ncbi:hypothetical protein Salat_2864900 [Sesamum alatum]|uniref:Bifunctional inhibitor/plant lipid transfer protein/seed storage helical domain-containing protein n=1 Tax=Sesamum alatum TaxID=300844 RepID=A0AAE1XMG1_9LAMI|nr:hypothetical protein Salat_2864900 [Sesamum alatum]